MKNQNQVGSAHVIVSVVFIAVLSGVLGFVYYQKLIADKSTGVSNSQAVANEKAEAGSAGKANKGVDTVLVKMNDVFTPGISFEYPGNWSETHKVQGATPLNPAETTIQTYEITSPDKQVKLLLGLDVRGARGGWCDPVGVSTLDLFRSEPHKDIDGYSYAEYIFSYEFEPGEWVVGQGIGKTELVNKIKTGSSRCDVGYLFVSNFPEAGGGAEPTVILSTELKSSASTDASNVKAKFDTLDKAKAYLASDTAQKVKDILFSIK